MIKINTCHLLDGPQEYSGTEPAAILELNGEISADGDIRYCFQASMAGQDLVIRGRAEVTIHAECARCLKAIRPVIRVPDVCIVREHVPEQEVDITQEVREELLLAFPSRFLCKETCKGLCPRCGANLNRGKCGCSSGAEDFTTPDEQSPWSVLDQLKTDGKKS